ncbi:Endoglucanase 13 [Vitis vinifera]|uniref:cellulase n=1 Tax=Vitis vinifera TaxID=29760 RepID=A0A438J293_VITVI|nr:Endoglucanase 13 [Vitis vinifera]
MSPKTLLPLGFSLLLLLQGAASSNYGAALTKSLLYFETQRSGKLPPNQRVLWRGDSALQDGNDAGVDLVGGYYDAGDNVKFGFPHAFTVTLLSWGVIEYGQQLAAKKELGHAMEAIKWGTDYFIKAHTQPNVLYGQVGDGDADHACWERPEDMTTPRTSYKIDGQHPGSDLAGETAAAFAAASMAFSKSDPSYSSQLLSHGKQLFDFAKTHQGLYQNSIPQAKFYASSGFEDELVWAAAWLYRATNDQTYVNYLGSANTGGTRSEFSWDDKYTGAQVLVAKFIMEGRLPSTDNWVNYKSHAEQFICNTVQKGYHNVKMTRGGALWWLSWNNFQYTTSALLLTISYADWLNAARSNLNCPNGQVSPDQLIAFARLQVDYILGRNPRGMSYMLGYGARFPQQLHHRGSSIVSIKKDKRLVTCTGGYTEWFNRQAPNPNIVYGAIAGGPDQYDNYNDSRPNYEQAESATVNTAPFVGVLARLA